MTADDSDYYNDSDQSDKYDNLDDSNYNKINDINNDGDCSDNNMYIEKYNLDKMTKIGYCICGHSICKHCVVENNLNGTRIVLGNCCVKDVDENYYANSNAIFRCINKLKNNILSKPNKQIIDFSKKKNAINDEDVIFLESFSTIRSKKRTTLSFDNIEKLVKTNNKIISFFDKKYESMPIKDQLKQLVDISNNNDIVKDFFIKYIQNNPSDEYNTYKLIEIDQGYEWKLVEQKFLCTICNNKFIYNECYTHYTIVDDYNPFDITPFNTNFCYKENDICYCSSCFNNIYCPDKTKYTCVLHKYNLSFAIAEYKYTCNFCKKESVYHGKYIFNFSKNFFKHNLENSSLRLPPFFLKNLKKCYLCFEKKIIEQEKLNNNHVNIVYEIKEDKVLYNKFLLGYYKECSKCKNKFHCDKSYSKQICNACFASSDKYNKCNKCSTKLMYCDIDYIVDDFNVCKSCLEAKKYIKYWEKTYNYKCGSCAGWNFRFNTASDEDKKKCFKCKNPIENKNMYKNESNSTMENICYLCHEHGHWASKCRYNKNFCDY